MLRHSLPLRPILWIGIFTTLLFPLAAMQVTDEVVWTLSDFVFAAGMFLVAGLAIEGILRATRAGGIRILAVLAVLAVFCLIWAEGAVGIF